MAKIVRLTEADLTRLVKRVIKEQENTNMVANKVETLIDQPKVEMKIENFYSNLTDQQKKKLKMYLDKLGIDEYTSVKEVHDIIDNAVGGEMMSGEMSEDDNENPRQKAAKILHAIGTTNIATWGGVPSAIAIGGMLTQTVDHPFATGFAISWGVTGLLVGLARLIATDKKTYDK
jgi:hypothetical protein